MERRLSAVLSYDVVGYGLAMGRDEDGTLEILKSHRREIIEPAAKQHRGRTIKLMGDGALMEFSSVVDAVKFAVGMQITVAKHNRNTEQRRRLLYRIGINVGDIIIDGDDIYGDGVNVAARLEALAEPGGICVRRNVRNQVRDKLALNFVDLGEVEVKNIARPVRAFHVAIDSNAEALAAQPVHPSRKKLSPFTQGAMGIMLALLLVSAWALWWPQKPEVEPASVDQMAYPIPEKPSIAVLPFEDLAGNADNAYFANGITRNLITELARFRNLFVIAHNSTAVYADQTASIREVSEALGVQYVLVGGVQRSQHDIRINVQLIDSLTGRHVWSERYDRPIADLFKVQDDVAQQIVATLAVQSGLIADAWLKRTELKGTTSLRAFDLDLQGWAANQNWTKEEFELAASLFQQAIAADPNYARPYANLAMNVVWQVYSKFAPNEELERALELAKKAVALDDGEAWGYWALGATYLKLEQYEQALTAYDQALQLNPNDADLLAESAFLFSWVGRPNEAIENVLTAMRLNPRHGDWYRWALGVAYYDARRYSDSVEVLNRRTLPNIKSNLYLAAAYGQLGLASEARLVVESILDDNPDSSIELWGRAQPYQNEIDLDHYIEGLRSAGLPERPPLTLPERPSIAVLAFDNLSGDPDQEFLSDAMSESIISELSRFPELFVIARNSSFQYKGTATDVRDIARDLGVRYLVEGGMQRADDTLRANAKLIDAQSGESLWAESFQRQNEDIFAVQDEIVMAIVTALAIKVEDAERHRASREATPTLEAYDLFLRARDLQLRKGFWIKEINNEVRFLLEKAVMLDNEFSRAYADLAWTHLYDFMFQWENPPEAARERARNLARRAVELDPASARAHHALGFVFLYEGDHELAAAEVERALSLNPNDAGIRDGLAILKIYDGDPEVARNLITEAMRLNPYHPDWYWHVLGWASYHADRYEEGLEAMKRIVNASAADHRVMAALSVRLGHLEEATNHAREVIIREPDFLISRFLQNLPYRNESDAENYADALAAAGLPE